MKRVIKRSERQEKSAVPDRYWVLGLHDAEIKQIRELILPADWAQQLPERTCLELLLDARGALFETDVRKILLYDYSVIAGELEELKKQPVYWISDSIREKSNGYTLNVELQAIQRGSFTLQVEFKDAVVERR